MKLKKGQRVEAIRDGNWMWPKQGLKADGTPDTGTITLIEDTSYFDYEVTWDYSQGKYLYHEHNLKPLTIFVQEEMEL